MKLDKRQFCIAVDTYKTMLEEEHQMIDALDISPEWKGADWIANYYDLLSDLCELEVDPYVGTDLDWFCFETDFGRKKDYCGKFMGRPRFYVQKCGLLNLNFLGIFDIIIIE